MVRRNRKVQQPCVIRVEKTEERHREFIRAFTAKGAYRIFQQRNSVHGFDADDWRKAEKKLVRDDFNGNTWGFDLLIHYQEAPQTILSLAERSLVILHGDPSHKLKGDSALEVADVHIFTEDIEASAVTVTAVDGVLQIRLPKKLRAKSL
jgi:Protein of unknown function (DUF2934)